MLTRVNKPALISELFKLESNFAAPVVFSNRIKGQLQNKGNVAKLSHYLKLLNTAELLAGLEKFTYHEVRRYSSSSKFQVQNKALLSGQKN
jgi:hypothetical protein